MGMIDKVFVVRRAYEVFLDRGDQSSFDALVNHLNDLYDEPVTLAEADEVFGTDYSSDHSCFWERVRNAKNPGVVPLMVLRWFYLHHRDAAEFDVTKSRAFRTFCGNHLAIVRATRDDEFEWYS